MNLTSKIINNSGCEAHLLGGRRQERGESDSDDSLFREASESLESPSLRRADQRGVESSFERRQDPHQGPRRTKFHDRIHPCRHQ